MLSDHVALSGEDGALLPAGSEVVELQPAERTVSQWSSHEPLYRTERIAIHEFDMVAFVERGQLLRRAARAPADQRYCPGMASHVLRRFTVGTTIHCGVQQSLPWAPMNANQCVPARGASIHSGSSEQHYWKPMQAGAPARIRNQIETVKQTAYPQNSRSPSSVLRSCASELVT